MTRPTLSIVIPALNAGRTLGPVLDALRAETGDGDEIVLCDGGSSDETVAIAHGRGVRIVTEGSGRGRQLRAGADAADGEWLLFLHADTRLPSGWRAAAAAYMRNPANRERAGYFAFALDDKARRARALEGVVALRCRLFALPYGDQGLLIARPLYDAVGGFDAVPLMEDVKIVRRLGRRRLRRLDLPAITSAERYRRGGYLIRSARNLACLTLYFLGVPPPVLKRIYN